MPREPIIGPALAAGALDALPSRIAIVDEGGTIVGTNAAWQAFADQHARVRETCGVGASYLAECLRAAATVPEAQHVATELRRVLDGVSTGYEAEYPCDGPDIRSWFRIRITPLLAGGARFALVAHDDVTRLHAAERSLDESLARYAGLAETSPDAIFVNRGNRITFANRAFLDLVGASDASQVLGRSPLDLLHPDDHDLVRSRINRMVGWQVAAPLVEERVVRLDGRVVPVEVVAAPFQDQGETAIHVVLRDISRRKSASEALTLERRRLAALLSALPDFVWMKDVSGRFVSASAAFANLIGGPPSQYLGRTDADFFPPHVVREFRRTDEAAIAGGPLTYEEWVTNPTTGWRMRLETTKVPVRDERGLLLGVLGIARDVTALRATADALRESERQMRLALEAAQLGTWKHVLNTDEVFHDERAARHVGLPEGPVPFRDLMERIHPEDRASLEERIARVMTTSGDALVVSELRVRHGDGSEHWISLHARVLFEGTGTARRPVLGFGTTQDITARKESEQAIARFMAASPSVIYALDVTPEGLVFKWSSGNLQAVTGWTNEEATSPGWWAANIHPDDRDRVIGNGPASAPPPHVAIEFRFRRRDGSYFWVRDERRTVTSASGTVMEVVGSWSDITARVHLEQQLRQAQKLEAIGQLAGGIAHDFNNLLTVIAGNTELLGQQLPVEGVERTRLEEIRDAGRRAAALTRQLLAFSRSQLLAPRVVELNTVVTRVETLLARLIGEDVVLTCDLSPETGHVKVDPGQLEQVIVNLGVNARDAMPNGGRLAISTARVTLDDDYCVRHPDVTPGSYARLRVTDNGLGIAPEVKAHMFEPFFTTKPVGKGTGLGLATVFGIVKQSGGHIEVESQLGGGASFDILLPSVEVGVARPRANGGPARAAAVGHETVLLVEDEASVRRLTHMSLERHGYRVLTAENGRAALEVAEQHGQAIDLLVTDVVMPEMSGRQLVDVMRRRWPGVKVLFMSGYIQDALDRHDVSREAFLHKPFTLADFAAAVRRVLDSPLARHSGETHSTE